MTSRDFGPHAFVTRNVLLSSTSISDERFERFELDRQTNTTATVCSPKIFQEA
jgi:hypothetical protein